MGMLDPVDLEPIKNTIQEAYLMDNRPWIVGFSGGKDSTFMSDLIIESLDELTPEQRSKRVYFISGDTEVEAPNVIEYLYRTVDKMRKAFEGTIYSIDVVKPERGNSFWENLIGKGYPAPVRSFRWCTDRMKIQPSNAFIMERIDDAGEVVICLGVRNQEGSNRKKSIAEHAISDSLFGRHSTMKNALTFAPIKDVTKDELWEHMLSKGKTEWKQSVTELYTLYREADRECPLVIDRETPSCGGNRFGCWTCTVISKDKSMEGFVESGKEDYVHLLNFRNFLQVSRDDLRMRSTVRRNGQKQTKDGEPVLGPYTFDARKLILKKLLWTQKQVGESLISLDQLDSIEKQWVADGWVGDFTEVFDGLNPEYDEAQAVYKKDGIIPITIFNVDEVNALENERI